MEEREELEERRAKLTLQLDEAIALKVAALFYSSWSSSSLYPDHKSFLITQPSKLRSQQHNNGNLPQIKNYTWRLQLTAAVIRWELPWKWREGAVLGGGRHQSAAHGGDQGDPREGGDFMFVSTFLRIINWQSLLTSIPGEVEGNSANSSVARTPQLVCILQGVFFNWAHPEFAKCRPVSNRFKKKRQSPRLAPPLIGKRSTPVWTIP